MTTMSKRDSPTANEQANMTWRAEGTGRREHRDPAARPKNVVGGHLIGLAVRLSGMMNTMKAVAPIEATAAACSKRSTKKVKKIAPEARELWTRAAFHVERDIAQATPRQK